ncbi:leucine-rich repeat domain-containing protein [Bacillus sp. CHD6a]|uniref:leucine-rich repeat domain-containing protein n=1 Tax=Bacillus sp. CHD6a TaxID=1643452 RepID=UPI0006CD644A|nr:leucine-rich repeat domain-containing protein [Bacillus sp. CHD6a]KPB05721.1 hypothetical protein AAV98_05395 [Bacillus sp. CHD6a]
MRADDSNGYFITEGDWNTGKVLVCTGDWNNYMGEVMQNKEIYYLRLSGAAGWKDNNINFLSTLQFLRGIEIYFSFSTLIDLTPLYSLENLEFLGIDDFAKGEIDFAKLTKLKTCLISWSSKYKNFNNQTELKHLVINKYPYENLKEISEMMKLEYLDITSSKLLTLDGIEALETLNVLKLYRCSNLRRLTGIEYLPNLKELEVDTCNKLHSVEEIHKMNSLVKILLENNKGLRNLGWKK